jgi:hypothetical protein
MNSKISYHEKYRLMFFTIIHRNVAKRKFTQYPDDWSAHPVTINLLLGLRTLQFEV